ncbi:outer membrane beta-barrel protein [Chryseobacterium sp. CT-SW4]|uniref:outer membrane beta-barrel protein n=1 Tax=Chryseobacterium sp. SW-1 TaxID=3157343 RepID=UPI003B018464
MNKWLNDLRQKMEEHTEYVPEDLWEDISEELFNDEKNKVIVPLVKNESPGKSGSRQWMYRLAGMAAALLLIFSVSYVLDLKNEKYFPEKKLPEVSSNNREDTRKVENQIPMKELSEKEIENNPEKMIVRSRKSTSYYHLEEEIIRAILLNKKDLAIRSSNFQNEIVIPETGDLPEVNLTLHKDNLLVNNNKPSPKEHKKKRNLMLSMLTGSASGSSSDQFPGYATAGGSPMSVNGEMWQSSEGNPLVDILLANQNKEVNARIIHKTPVTLGMSLYYGLGNKWGIGTGVNYTKLSSEVHSGSESDYIKMDQSVHYIGVPVQVNYNVIKKGRFTGYVTAGALAEKAVSGKLTTKYIVDNGVKEEKEEKINIKPVQFSVNSALGVQLKVINNIGIYAEPGVTYHFSDKSPLNTIYKEKPFNFNVRFGIRLQID